MIPFQARAVLTSLLPVALLACGSSSPTGIAPPEKQQWSELVSGGWSLEPGTEDARWCQKYPVTEDTYVAAIRPVHPPGTHHTTLSLVDDNGSPSCAGTAFGGGGMIFAAGVGSTPVQIPEGVAIKLPAGKALLLNLHVYNTTDAPMSGTSKIEIVRAKAEDVKALADLMFAGPTSFSLPPQAQTTLEDTCQLTDDQTAFALFPHMHQLGRHIKTTFTVDGSAMVVHDAPYDFEEQYQLPIGPIALHQGDTVKTECTYDNTTTKAVTFGESSETEMCFSIIYRYPATGRIACGIRQ